MGQNKAETLPILPLPYGSVLLPGVTLRIPVSGRSDIPALLSAVYTKDRPSKLNSDAIHVGCLPINSPFLRSDGQQLLGPKDTPHERQDEVEIPDPSGIDHRRLFMYGSVAVITGVHGRRSDGLSLVVQGVQRFRVERFRQMRPFFEAEVALLDVDDVGLKKTGESFGQTTPEAFERLKELSLELLRLVRLSAFMPRSSTTLSPFLTRRLEAYVSKKQYEEADVLTDFMANIVEATLEDKLRLLAATEIFERASQVTDLLVHQIDSIKNNSKIIVTTSQSTPKSLDIRNSSRMEREALLRRALGGLGTSSPSGAIGPGDNDGDGEPNDIEELEKKVADAKLTPEAQKTADREIKKLKKLNVNQAEYGVCRTYIETLSEVPWTTGTEEQLGIDTLKRARKQLDDDHYGLQKIKKRLLEYLAVLRLKQAVNNDIENQIAKASEQRSTETSELHLENSEKGPHELNINKIEILEGKRRVDKSPILLLVGPPVSIYCLVQILSRQAWHTQFSTYRIHFRACGRALFLSIRETKLNQMTLGNRKDQSRQISGKSSWA